MTSNPFLLGEALTAERLSWIAGTLKYFYVNIHPDAFRHSSEGKNPFFTFFLTGDALYSLADRELLKIWEIILSLPQVRVVCDREELDLRGLSIDSLLLKFPGQVSDQNGKERSYPRSFWRELVRVCRKHEPSALAFGYLLLKSPYMNRSCQNALDCCHAAAEEQTAPELYAYLDGIHALHINQKPAEFRNIGLGFSDLYEMAKNKDQNFRIIACERCAGARGYSTWDDGQGTIVSNCTIEGGKIRNLKEIVERFACGHPILAESAAMTDIRSSGSHPPKGRRERGIPPLTLLVTKAPYSTESVYGAISFAIACAYGKVPTSIIFIEDGIYTLTGTHRPDAADMLFSMQEVLGTAAGNDLIGIYAYLPSFQERGVAMGKDIRGVLGISVEGLGQILFFPPAGTPAGHQRILFF